MGSKRPDVFSNELSFNAFHQLDAIPKGVIYIDSVVALKGFVRSDGITSGAESSLERKKTFYKKCRVRLSCRQEALCRRLWDLRYAENTLTE